ncbi:hypothetical protein ACFQYP_02185 [Nonomuraea antimicrobica]
MTAASPMTAPGAPATSAPATPAAMENGTTPTRTSALRRASPAARRPTVTAVTAAMPA